MKKTFWILLRIMFAQQVLSQNLMVGDGFGGRLWYKPYNYTTGSYSAYTICGEEKQLYAWGNNSIGQLGNGNYIHSTNAVQVLGMSNVKYYSTGYIMGAIKEDNSGWTWGNPMGPINNAYNPTKVIDDVYFVDGGMTSLAFVKLDGTVWSVGLNQYGEFGDGIQYEPFSHIPKQMNNIQNAVRTAQGEYTTAVLLKNGEVWVSGRNTFGGLGATCPDVTIAQKVDGLPFIVDIKSNSSSTIALDQEGNVWQWGNGYFSPSKLIKSKNIVAIAGCNDGSHFLALDENHNCFGWGLNSFGQLGISNTMYSTQIPQYICSDVNDIMCGEYYSYIIKTDGSLWASGSSAAGAGTSSIWLNLSNITRCEFTKLDLTIPELNLCNTKNEEVDTVAIIDTVTTVLPDSSNLVFPNAFTPNGDGLNDYFGPIIKDISKIEFYELTIYNRLGNRVFHSTNPTNRWKDSNADIGTYYYYCSYKVNKLPLYAKGDVSLIR